MVETRWLGRVRYHDALALQEELVARKIADPSAPDSLLLLEHELVYTIGRTPDQSSLRDLSSLDHLIVQTNRGGQATCHGPGQLVGYPILDLRVRGQDLHAYLRVLEQIIIETAAHFRVTAARREGLTGVWVEDRKLASIGVGVRRWISMHGFALNVTTECLAGFARITPCGISDVQMTSLDREAGHALDVESCAEVVAGIASSLLRQNQVDQPA
ncbi:MAG: lipoyl(octanoyl) transferase LipB [Chthoniobacteraceae bacterium]